MNELWPELPLDAWKDTYATLHLWSQIVGKVRTKLSPPVNHWWHSVYYVSSRGLTTPPIPFGNETFEMEFDLIDHFLAIRTSRGDRRAIVLSPRSVADFYADLMSALKSLGIDVRIHPISQELPTPIRLDQDREHASYDPEYARRFFRVLLQSDTVFKEFRGRFIGKCSPVQFFWGSFDLAVTRFSGRRAPVRPGADRVTREAYSHEVISLGFWPGSGNVNGPAFYCYASPEPEGFSEAAILPSQAFYNPPTKGFILMYDEVRKSQDPKRMLLDFAQSTYAAGADLAHWDRESFERSFALRKRAA